MAGPKVRSARVGPSRNGDSMPDKDDLKDIPDEDEDWMSYANAGFGSTDYSLGMMQVKKPKLSLNQIGMMRIYNSIQEKRNPCGSETSRTQASSENWIL